LPSVAPLLITFAKFPAALITKIAFAAASFPVIQMKSALIIVALATALFLMRRYLIWVIPILLMLTYLQRWPNNHWQIANCDVGQGDAMVLKVAPKSAVLIDVGPDPKLIDQCLKALSINEIPLLILTHPHADHVGGLVGAVRNRKIGKILQDARRGEVIKVGELKISFLWPDGGEHVFQDYGGEGSAINNQSAVALIESPDYSLLTTGDIEPEVQAQIAVSKVDYLKVAHHGSKYQDQNFNLRANPEIAIISVGKGNKYGHPAEATEKLFRQVYRTDQAGAIAIDPIANSVSSSKVGLFGLPVLWRVT
jgi:competence protein ComEC